MSFPPPTVLVRRPKLREGPWVPRKKENGVCLQKCPGIMGLREEGPWTLADGKRRVRVRIKVLFR